MSYLVYDNSGGGDYATFQPEPMPAEERSAILKKIKKLSDKDILAVRLEPVCMLVDAKKGPDSMCQHQIEVFSTRESYSIVLTCDELRSIKPVFARIDEKHKKLHSKFYVSFGILDTLKKWFYKCFTCFKNAIVFSRRQIVNF
jgi:hypothetical protein